MALPGIALMRLRAIRNLGKCVESKAGFNVTDVRWYTTDPCSRRDTEPPVKQGNADHLKEFRDPKNLLYNAITRSLGLSDTSQLIQYSCTDHGAVKRATVTLAWPSKVETEGFSARRVDAERLAAAAACHTLKEMGVLGPGNKLPSRKSGRETGTSVSEGCEAEKNGNTSGVHDAAAADATDYSEALSLFPHPKALLVTVLQLAMPSSSLKELMQYRTVGSKVKRCELTLMWPKEIKVTAMGKKRVTAEKRAAALACMKLKELELLDENNQALTHAKYHKQEVKDAADLDRRPVSLHIPLHLERSAREYLAQYPMEKEMQRLEENNMPGQEKEQCGGEEGGEAPVKDAITGRRHVPLSAEGAQQLSAELLDRWERADPRLATALPVDDHRDRVVEAVEASPVVVIAGETGCGKTTRIPRFLLEGRVRAGEGAACNILVTQPRRISAVSVAQRVAHEMGPVLRGSVGHQVRLESRPPEQSGGALLFLTVGVLLRKLLGNPGLRGISHVVVDEVHERDINTDLLLALLRGAQRENPDLHVVLMSATGDNLRLAEYFNGCPVVKVPGFMHPVQSYYLEDVLSEMGRRTPRGTAPPRRTRDGREEAAPDLDLVADVIAHIDRSGEPGAVLCFLPGWQDIKGVQERLESKRFASGSPLIVPLHSSLSVADQQVVFQRPPVGRRKIVLATNIAETSITIDDIVHVVDTGTQKEQNYDTATKVSCLDTVWISRSNVTQRQGRAGRCQPGHAYHLFPRERLESMPNFPIPEILRTPLESLVLQAKVHNPNLNAVEFLSQVLDSPGRDAVKGAVRTLRDIGLLDRTETLTLLGEHVASLSCDPRLGKALVLAAMFRCVLPMLSVVACLTRDPFYNSLQNRGRVAKAKEALSGSSCSDFLVLSRAVLGWRKILQTAGRGQQQYYLEENVLSWPSLRFINGLMSQYSENLYQAKLVSQASQCQAANSMYNEHSKQDELVKAVLLASLYPNLIQVKKGVVAKGGRFRAKGIGYRTQSGPVLLHRSSVNTGKSKLPSRWLTFFTAIKSGDQVFARDSSAVHPLALLLLTDGDIAETVRGDRVEVSFPGRSLGRCELPVATWEVLWELRTSLQAMLHRNLSQPEAARAHAVQDGQLLDLLVRLLNHDVQGNPSEQTAVAGYHDDDSATDAYDAFSDIDDHSDSEVD